MSKTEQQTFGGFQKGLAWLHFKHLLSHILPFFAKQQNKFVRNSIRIPPKDKETKLFLRMTSPHKFAQQVPQDKLLQTENQVISIVFDWTLQALKLDRIFSMKKKTLLFFQFKAYWNVAKWKIKFILIMLNENYGKTMQAFYHKVSVTVHCCVRNIHVSELFHRMKIVFSYRIGVGEVVIEFVCGMRITFAFDFSAANANERCSN